MKRESYFHFFDNILEFDIVIGFVVLDLLLEYVDLEF